MEEIVTKADLDDAIMFNIDKVVCIRFGQRDDLETMKLDEIVCITYFL